MTFLTRCRFELLVPAGVTFVAVVAGVFLSPWIDRMPGLNQPCALRAVTGWPCLACGGTRSVQALASGNVVDAFKFNPLVFLAVCASAVWLVVSSWRAWHALPLPVPVGAAAVQSDAALRSRKLRWGWWLLWLAALAVANWIYLVKTLPA